MTLVLGNNPSPLDIAQSRLVMKITEDMLDSVTETKPITIDRFTKLGFDEDEEDKDFFAITTRDPETDDDEDAIYLNRYTVRTLQLYADSIQKIPAGKSVYLSQDMDITYDKGKKRWRSNQVILSDAVIRDIQAASESAIKGLKPGACYVYAYAQNGVHAKIKVTVKEY